jgi:DNA-binding NtrC family response regulator
MPIRDDAQEGSRAMVQAPQKHRAVLIVEDDAELRKLAAALFEDEKVDTIECESAEAALAIMLIGGQDIAMIFADIRLPGAMDGVDLAWEVKQRWPLLPMILTSGHPREHGGELPPLVGYMPKPWQPLSVLIAAERALASARSG